MTDPSSEEKIFDSLLEEMLTGQHPPDLTQRIQQRFRDELGAAAGQPIAAAPVCSSNRTASSHANWHGVIIAILSLAAGLLLALTVWQLWPAGQPSDTPGSNRLANSENRPSDAQPSTPAALENSNASPVVDPRQVDRQLAERSRTVPDAVAGSGSSTASSSPASAPPPREAIALDRLPFNSQPASIPSTTDATTDATRSVEPWKDQEIVAWVDERFRRLWSAQQLQPTPSATDDELLSRVSQVLTGEQQAIASSSPRDLASKLLPSATFAEHWADRAVAYWLRGTPAADKKDKDGAALRAAIAQQIVARQPWNSIVASLINSEPERPQATFLTMLAGGNNHRLAGRIGSTIFDSSLACARCHDAIDNGRIVSIDQDEYWSLVALLSGVDGQVPKGSTRRVLVDRQPQLFADGKSPNVFFDRPDGRLQAAQYRLPDGDNWRKIDGVQTPRQALARWIETTSVGDQAAVNLAWRLVFGRPLVAQHAALDGAGLAERREILTGLAEQFQAHNRDMGQLVGWIVASQPFSRPQLTVDREAWLLASEQQIAQWNASATNFASFARPAVVNKQLASLDGALASVVRWSGAGDQRRATLAQPTFSANEKKGKVTAPTAAALADQPAATYLIRSLQPTAAQSELVERLVASRLSWPQQVEHIAGLVGEAGNDSKLQRSAEQLLKSKNGDRTAALHQLLQCAQLCEESL